MDKKWLILGLLLLSLSLYFFTANHWSLQDADESFYASIAREMVQDGDWLTLHYNGVPFFHKPPLVFWLVAISYKIFGVNEVSARLPIIILAIMSILLIYLLAWELFHDFYTSFFSSLILLTTYHFLHIGHLVMTDVPTIFFILLGLYGLIRSSVKKEWAALYGLGLGLAILSKGVLGAALIICILPYIIWQKKFSYLRNPYLWIGFICGMMLCGSWYFHQIRVHGNIFLKIHFWQQVVQRSQEKMHESGDLGVLFYPMQVLLNFFPWSIILPFSLFENIKGFFKKREEHSLIIGWVVTFFIIIAMMRTKLPHYCLSFYPFFAISVGQFTSRIFREGGFLKRLVAINWIYLVFSLAILFVIFLAMKIQDYSIYRKYIPVALAISIFFITLSLFYLFAVRNKRMLNINQIWIKLLSSGTYILLVFAILTLKIWDFNPEIKQLAEVAAQNIYFIHIPDRPDVGDAVRFYHSGVTEIKVEDARKILQGREKGIFLTTKEMVKQAGFKKCKIIAQSGDWLLIKK